MELKAQLDAEQGEKLDQVIHRTTIYSENFPKLFMEITSFISI